uniref:Uncharacterized protein n=1 Tax=Rhizophora mucronata TaxID=61149 RepID=A0A2P2QRQ8_RHIMU
MSTEWQLKNLGICLKPNFLPGTFPQKFLRNQAGMILTELTRFLKGQFQKDLIHFTTDVFVDIVLVVQTQSKAQCKFLFLYFLFFLSEHIETGHPSAQFCLLITPKFSSLNVPK